MTNTERIQTNNAELRECIELAEKLPDAGTNVEVILQSKTVTPTKDVQNIMADADYTALEQVTVEAIPDEYIIPSGTKEITENGKYDAKSYESVNVNVPVPDGYVSTDDADATAADMRKGKTAYVDGMKITGSIEDFDGSYECSGEGTGESTGGVNIETCTVTVMNYSGLANNPDEFHRTFAYTDSSLNGVSVILPTQEGNGLGWNAEPLIHTFTVAKGTIVYAVSSFSLKDTASAVIPIFNNALTMTTNAAIVNGDCTININ